ncbi:hypothetical protein BDQ12DRAFT_685398 [Crucibulum laeve]|uniref:Uncharacterized protein n=1 Tax=Crucibulum laeve TaxID=68775 RepID=A0A5C3LYL4_9AGAR|nr:hypothetical protein BDQ12DRAFT_685398 [Crucibulum laeve]
MSKPSSFLSSTVTAVSNHFKPHRAEAIQRIRLNAVFLVALLLLSYLLPIPSLPRAFTVVLASTQQDKWTREWVYRWFCILEVALMSISTFNLVEAIYAVKYPRAVLPPRPSPMQTKTASKTASTTPKRPFKVLSPNSSPQAQKPFTYSPSASFSASSLSMSSSTTYPASPVSTPSRVLQYSVPASSSTQGSSTSTVSYLATPSPVISAYRGKHLSSSVGRAFDGSYLGRVKPEEPEESEAEL